MPPKLKPGGELQGRAEARALVRPGVDSAGNRKKAEVQIGAFFDRRLCNARRFAVAGFLLVCEYDVSDWQDPEPIRFNHAGPLPGGDWRD